MADTWLMIEEPEESKYTADLTIFYQDPDKPESNFIYVPTLRRSLRLATTARCAPLFSTDFTHDDERAGFNGGISTFDATYLRDQKVIALADLTTAAGGFPQNYAMPLGFARPSWGDWSVRDTYVLDVRRIPQEASGYCYSKRILYVDKAFFHEQWMELYDAQMRLWKIGTVEFSARIVPNVGVATLSSLALQFWDMQNDHATFTFTADGAGRDINDQRSRTEAVRQHHQVFDSGGPGADHAASGLARIDAPLNTILAELRLRYAILITVHAFASRFSTARTFLYAQCITCR